MSDGLRVENVLSEGYLNHLKEFGDVEKIQKIFGKWVNEELLNHKIIQALRKIKVDLGHPSPIQDLLQLSLHYAQYGEPFENTPIMYEDIKKNPEEYINRDYTYYSLKMELIERPR